jgi:cell division transport system permease protein
MSSAERKLRKKKLGSYPFLSVVFSITLSLLVIGLFGVILIYSNALTKLIQENIEIQVFLNKSITESERIKISKTLSSKPYVLTKDSEPQVSLITKEQAAEKFIRDTGEDFVEFIGENPLRDALTLKIAPDYHEKEQMLAIRSEIEAERGVYEVSYVENMVESVSNNLAKIGLMLSGIAILLILVVVVLINNTIKLALFSQRFLIRSMQLVGATSGFIKGPFIKRAANYGFVAGIIASAILYGILEYANTKISDLAMLNNDQQILALMISLILIGVLVGLLSTFRAVNRYLKMSLDELY